jgi:hypothetical protein
MSVDVFHASFHFSYLSFHSHVYSLFLLKEKKAYFHTYFFYCILSFSFRERPDPPERYGLVLKVSRAHIDEKNYCFSWNGRDAWEAMVGAEEVLAA